MKKAKEYMEKERERVVFERVIGNKLGGEIREKIVEVAVKGRFMTPRT